MIERLLCRRDLLAAAAGAMTVSASWAAPAHADRTLSSALEDWAPKKLPGVTAAIVRSETTIARAAAGWADITRHRKLVAADAIGVGSITKTFVAIIALQLTDEGHLDLSATARAAIGLIADGIPNAGTATLEQMLNHTSGIPSWEDDPVWIHAGRGKGQSPTRSWASAETLNYIRNKPALFAPGMAYSYSNTNYTLLGLAIERATGLSLTKLLKARILEPLRLRHTYLEGFSQPDQPTPVAHRYHYDTAGFETQAGLSPYFRRVHADILDVTQSNLSCEWAAGALVTTAEDLATAFAALRAGHLVSPQRLAFMQQWRLAVQTPDGPLLVGHGLFRQKVADAWIIGHTGGALGSTACAFWIEDAPITFTVLSNVGVEHIQVRRTNATSIGQDAAFLKLAKSFA
jgi:D-alanyl-D-alanine carboxypeptidase